MPRQPHTAKRLLAMLPLFLLGWGLHNDVWAQYGNYSNYNDLPPDSTQIYLDSAKTVGSTAPTQAIQLLNRALEAAIVNRNLNGEARAYLLLANMQRRLGLQTEAIESITKCKRLFTGAIQKKNQAYLDLNSNSSYQGKYQQRGIATMDRTILREATQALTLVLEAEHRWEAAFTESEEWLQLTTTVPPKQAQDEALRAQARIKSKMGKTAEATRRFADLVQEEEKTANQPALCETLIDLGEHLQRNGQSQKAEEALKRAKDLATTQRSDDLNIRATDALATLFNDLGDHNQEVQLRNNVVAMQRSLSRGGDDYFQNLAIGNAYLADNNLDSAAQYLQTGVNQYNDFAPQIATNTLTQTGSTSPQQVSVALQAGADAYRKLAEGYLKKSELEKSLEFYKKYAVLQDSVKAVQARELETALELSKNVGKNEERVQLLERERDLSDKSIELLQQDQAAKSSQILTRNLIIGVLIACLILAVVAGFILTRNTRARRRADKLLALQSMTGQMNPHFIFNALNSVNEFISQNDERAANRYLTSFSRLMRKVMDDSKQTFITLQDETDMLKLYLELEHARFKDQFQYEFVVADDLEAGECLLPPMIVQPYIENAVWHGLRYRKGGGHLSVRFERGGDGLAITIQDDGIGISRSKAIKTAQQKRQHSMGMKNIGTRMGLMNEIYGSQMTVTVSETHPGAEYPGTTVHIHIPQSHHTQDSVTP